MVTASSPTRETTTTSRMPDIDPDILIGNVAEILPNQLYFACFSEDIEEQIVKNKVSYVSFHGKFHYEPFYQDFGPWNLSVLYRLCVHIDNHVVAEERRGRKTVMYCTKKKNMDIEKVRVNCAYTLASYLIIYHGYTADDAYLAVSGAEPPKFVGFRDAAMGEPSYLLHVHDVLRGVEKALQHGWLDFTDFNYREYEYYEKVENGDFNWIIPGKFLSFCGPHNESRVEDGYPYHAPDVYFDYFRDHGVSTIVRLNAKNYDAKKFTKAGFEHVDLFFVDGSTPSDEIVEKFIRVVDNARGGVAVHCKAGLGRTGTLIACWMMKEYGLTACDCMAWLRICRPGSVIGPQQRFLIDKQKYCWGLSNSNGVHLPNLSNKKSSRGSEKKVKKLTNGVDELCLSTNDNEAPRPSSPREKSSTKTRDNARPRPKILPLRRKPQSVTSSSSQQAESSDVANGNVVDGTGYVDETALDEKGRSQGDRLLAMKVRSQHKHEAEEDEEEEIVLPAERSTRSGKQKSKSPATANGEAGRPPRSRSHHREMVVPSQAYLNKNREPIAPQRHQNNAANNGKQIRSSNGQVMYRTRQSGGTGGSTLPRTPASAIFPSMASRRSDLTRFSSPTTPIKPMSPASANLGSLRYRTRQHDEGSSAMPPHPPFGLVYMPKSYPTSSANTLHRQSSCFQLPSMNTDTRRRQRNTPTNSPQQTSPPNETNIRARSGVEAGAMRRTRSRSRTRPAMENSNENENASSQSQDKKPRPFAPHNYPNAPRYTPRGGCHASEGADTTTTRRQLSREPRARF